MAGQSSSPVSVLMMCGSRLTLGPSCQPLGVALGACSSSSGLVIFVLIFSKFCMKLVNSISRAAGIHFE